MKISYLESIGMDRFTQAGELLCDDWSFAAVPLKLTFAMMYCLPGLKSAAARPTPKSG